MSTSDFFKADFTELSEMVTFMRQHGVLKLEHAGTRLELSEVDPKAKEQPPREVTPEDRAEYLARIEDETLLSDPLEYERIKTTADIDAALEG